MANCGIDIHTAKQLMLDFEEYLRCAHPYRPPEYRKLFNSIRNWWSDRLLKETLWREEALLREQESPRTVR